MIANRILGSVLDTETMLDYCTQIEGHPDNVGASLLGGVVACCPASAGI